VGLLAALPASSARAQYFYPGGYGGYGWGGWGGGTVGGDYARGLGQLAAGAGVYNQQTAVANSINANTAMQVNEYLYESQQVQNRKYWARRDADLKQNNAALSKIQERLRNAPSASDIDSGDALNVYLDDLSDPRLSYQVSRLADAKLQGSLIRNIPFRNAVEAVTFSLGELGHRKPAAIFLTPPFEQDLKAYRETTAEINRQAEETQTVNPETVRKLRSILQDAYDKLKPMQGLDPKEKFDAERHLRAAMSMSHMLDGPSLNVFLEGIESRNDITLAKLLGFMQSFNLRFGVVKNPNQRDAYRTLQPLLAAVRKEAYGSSSGPLPPTDTTLANRTERPKDFFAGVNPEELNKAKAKPPAPPAPKP
jgi:hypothetical protein